MSSLIPPLREEIVFLGLGSNLGDRLQHLQRAVRLLHADPRATVEDVSSVYETSPVGGPDQDDFCNLVVRLRSRRSPWGVLDVCARVEQALGRRRAVRFGPRTIDVDVLLYGARVVTGRRLQVPHPRLTERAFALVPLMEVAPGWTLPDGRTLSSLVAALAPIEGVRPIGRQVSVPA